MIKATLKIKGPKNLTREHTLRTNRGDQGLVDWLRETANQIEGELK